MYTDKMGKVHNVNYCSDDFYKSMIERGWRPIFEDISEYGHSAQEMYDKLSETYGVVKIYYTTTMVRGYHDNIAFVKRF